MGAKDTIIIESLGIGGQSRVSYPMLEATRPQEHFGIPVHTNPHIPEGHGVLTSECRHTYEEQQADGGGIMHLAKRHTVILKFDAPSRTQEEE